MDRAYPQINRLLEEASAVVRRSKEAAGDAKSPESYKRRQIEQLKSFATSKGLWMDFTDSSVLYLDKGGENEVFYDGASTIYKLNNFEYASDDLDNFFIRMFAHNHFFGNVPYELIGFSYNSKEEFSAVLVQPYIQALREATEEEIATYMQSMGFEMDYEDEFHTETHIVFDVVPNNVLCGIDGELYFFDTQIRLIP